MPNNPHRPKAVRLRGQVFVGGQGMAHTDILDDMLERRLLVESQATDLVVEGVLEFGYSSPDGTNFQTILGYDTFWFEDLREFRL